jgi:hypothetical protein
VALLVFVVSLFAMLYVRHCRRLKFVTLDHSFIHSRLDFSEAWHEWSTGLDWVGVSALVFLITISINGTEMKACLVGLALLDFGIHYNVIYINTVF